jgi:ferritin
MISDKMLKALNSQINEELYSAYLYLSMAAWFETLNLKGFANWMMVQNQEEQIHAMKIYNFINDRGGKVALQTVKEPPAEWKSPQDAFEASLKHEQHITGKINELVQLAMEEKDRASQIFLEWFVTEQVEEEASAEQILTDLELVGKEGKGIFMIDRELGQRQFTPEADE